MPALRGFVVILRNTLAPFGALYSSFNIPAVHARASTQLNLKFLNTALRRFAALLFFCCLYLRRMSEFQNDY